jgi:dihydropyrimidine dehydrogenase (NAD+) subunit PreA
LAPARAAVRGGADAVSLINTVNSIVSIDLDLMAPEPVVDGKGTHGGYCGPAVKPIALHMVAEISRDPECKGIPISGIGGIETWREAAEFIALGAGTVQVCTAAMHFRAKAIPNVTDWQYLNLNYKTIAAIDQDMCIKCGLCHIACEDTSHQAISAFRDGALRRYEVIDKECVGCNLCMYVCPVEGCITMVPVDTGKPALDWTQHPNNPLRHAAE